MSERLRLSEWPKPSSESIIKPSTRRRAPSRVESGSTGDVPPIVPNGTLTADGGNIPRVLEIIRTMDAPELRELRQRVTEELLG